MTEIRTLWRAHSDTLGFLPAGAFDEHLSKREILVALDGSRCVIGYLLFRKGTDKASIVHLCVADTARGQGIAKALVRDLSERTKRMHGIDLYCRRDFGADKVWPRLGFSARGEKPGRSSAGSTLTHWWLDHGIPHLFSNLRVRDPVANVRVVIDANIFFDLVQTPPAREESAALLADWLQVELCVTEEMSNEIHRQEDPMLREQHRLFMSRFPVVQTRPDKFDKIQARLVDLLPPEGTSDESDLRQLARTIGADVTFFVTRDQRLLDAAEKIYDTFQLHVLRPAELISRFDELQRELEYQPIRFLGTQLRTNLVHADACERLEIFQAADRGEKKASFLAKVRSLLAMPEKFCVMLVTDPEGAPLALFAHTTRPAPKTQIVLFRISRGAGMPTLSRFLVSHILNFAASTSARIVEFDDQGSSESFPSTLAEFGFFKSETSVWTKVMLSGIWRVDELSTRLASEAAEIGCSLPPGIDAISSPEDVIRVEGALWPLKITGGGISNFIIPIQPAWAMHLFDSKLAAGDLFGGRSDLMLSHENVYYRSAKPGIVTYPGRILWYVSQSRQQPGSGALRAYSMIDRVFIDTPKTLYRMFRRLGIYEWRKVLETARGHIERKIMAIQFSRTELFKTPIPFNKARSVLAECAGIQTTFQSPVAIPDVVFERLYRDARSIG